MNPVRRRSSTVFFRYLVMQLPSFFAAALLLALLVQHGQLTPEVAGWLFAAWVAFEIALFPVFRIGYEPGGGHIGVEAMVGSVGVARDDLDPSGTVLLGAERWRAEAAPGHTFIRAGTAVRVCAVDQLRLVVEPFDPAGLSRPRSG